MPSGFAFSRTATRFEIVGDINFVTNGGNEQDLSAIALTNERARELLKAAVVEVMARDSVDLVRVKALHDKGGFVLVDGEPVVGTGFESDPVDVDLITVG